MNITNDTQLKAFLLDITEVVIDDVTEKLHKKLLENIESYVYDGSNKWYAYDSGSPTHQFAESWQFETKKKGDQIASTIEQNYSVMESDPDNFVHGSNYYSNSDAREWISYYINEGASGPGPKNMFANSASQRARPFWDETMKLIDNGTIDKWIRNAYKSYGITLK